VVTSNFCGKPPSLATISKAKEVWREKPAKQGKKIQIRRKVEERTD